MARDFKNLSSKIYSGSRVTKCHILATLLGLFLSILIALPLIWLESMKLPTKLARIKVFMHGESQPSPKRALVPTMMLMIPFSNSEETTSTLSLFFKEEKFLTGDVAEASFEKKLRIKDVRGTPPNLDFFISDKKGDSDANGNMIGIESKFTEPLDCKSKNKKSIQEAYFKTPFLDENKNKKAFELA